MFLYELALELGVRSTALLDRAHALGMQVDTTAQLTPDQIEQLRSAYGKGRAQQAHEASVQQARAELEGADQAGGGSMNLAAIAALVAAGLVVVLMVGYMLTNSDNDTTTVGAGDTTDAEGGSSTTTEPCDSGSGIGVGAIGQDPGTTAGGAETTIAQATGATTAPADDALPPCDVVGGLSGDEIAAASTTFDGDPLDLPRDKREFCRAALSIIEFETKMYEVSNPEALGPVREVMLGGRDKFKADLAAMQAAAPPRIDGPLGRYAISYTTLMDSVTPTTDDYSLAVAFAQASRADLAYYATQINAAVTENCDKR